jgi:hypothetical protein
MLPKGGVFLTRSTFLRPSAFKCQNCGKQYARRDHLTQHLSASVNKACAAEHRTQLDEPEFNSSTQHLDESSAESDTSDSNSSSVELESKKRKSSHNVLSPIKLLKSEPECGESPARKSVSVSSFSSGLSEASNKPSLLRSVSSLNRKDALLLSSGAEDTIVLSRSVSGASIGSVHDQTVVKNKHINEQSNNSEESGQYLIRTRSQVADEPGNENVKSEEHVKAELKSMNRTLSRLSIKTECDSQQEYSEAEEVEEKKNEHESFFTRILKRAI